MVGTKWVLAPKTDEQHCLQVFHFTGPRVVFEKSPVYYEINPHVEAYSKNLNLLL